jgi:hypothetical protein
VWLCVVGIPRCCLRVLLSRKGCKLSESVCCVCGLVRRMVGLSSWESVYLAYIYIYSIYRDEVGIRFAVVCRLLCFRYRTVNNRLGIPMVVCC